MGDYFRMRDDFLDEYHPAHGKRAEYYKKKLGRTYDPPANVRVMSWRKDSAGRTFVKMNNDVAVTEKVNELNAKNISYSNSNTKGMKIDIAFQRLLAEKHLEEKLLEEEKLKDLKIQKETELKTQQLSQQTNDLVS